MNVHLQNRKRKLSFVTQNATYDAMLDFMQIRFKKKARKLGFRKALQKCTKMKKRKKNEKKYMYA